MRRDSWMRLLRELLSRSVRCCEKDGISSFRGEVREEKLSISVCGGCLKKRGCGDTV